MGKILAIDLGTSNSAVAVAETLSGEAFHALPELPGYSVIADRFRRRTTPSVVAEDDKGNIVVGHAAKARAGRSPEPIMFAKRSMGEDVTFQLNRQGTLSPVDVSAHILRYLKEMAEQQLGEKVTQAIITVPAYFALKATQMTKEAAARAGLEVLQILPEPVAAALMYCASDPRESIRVMTYDLGGGTFDVAILEKINGRISVESIKAFDGDRFLGGYNFDRAIAFWLIDRLKDQGFDLDLNHDNPADRVIFAKMLIYAERAKMELSKADASEIVEPSTGFEDHSGNPVAIELTLSRSEFEGMIAKEVERTIDLCHLAICAAADTDNKPEARSPAETHEIERLDEILMVGGSSRIPAISRRLELEFRRTPRLLEPDLCVALGAAVLAGSRKKTVVANCLELDSLPTSSPVPFIQLTGVARPEGTGPSSCQLILRSLDGGFRKALQLPEDGRFAFTGVPINRSATTDFAIELRDPSGSELGSHRFSVAHVDQLTAGVATSTKAVVVSGTRTNFLAKPILVVWRDSTEVVAPKRTPLPFDCKIQAQTADKSGKIRITIKEENTPLGEIIMKDLPDTLPIGSELEVSLEITENCEINARAYVKALAREELVTLHLPLRPVRTTEELRRDFAALEARTEDAIRSAGAGALFGGGRSKRLKERISACGEMLNSPDPDRPAIQDCMDEIEGLLAELTLGWSPDPARDDFDNRVKKIWDLHASLIKALPETESEGFDKQIEAIVKEAEDAYNVRDAARWKQGWDRLGKLMSTMRDRNSLPPSPVTPTQLKLMCHQELKGLESSAQLHKRYDENAAEFDSLRESLEAIKVSDPNATDQLFGWYEQGLQPLTSKLQKQSVPIDDEGRPVKQARMKNN